MPSHQFHCALDRQFFGREYPEVHLAMDKPIEDLGFMHRVIFHNPWDIWESDPEIRHVVAMHIWADWALTPIVWLFDPATRADWHLVNHRKDLSKGLVKWKGKRGIHLRK